MEITERFTEFYLDTHPDLREAYMTMRIAGLPFEFLDGPIEVGDTYLAVTSRGLRTYACFEATDHHVIPMETGYVVKKEDCFRIRLNKS